MRSDKYAAPDMAARSGFLMRKPRKDLYLRSYTRRKTTGGLHVSNRHAD
jgi:hypothetical protein